MASGLFVLSARFLQFIIEKQVSSIALCAWLGGLQGYRSEGSTAAPFMTIEEIGGFLESQFK